MFKVLDKLIERDNSDSDSPNLFFTVSENDIQDAEARLNFRFPSQLRTFFTEIGSGFLKASAAQLEVRKFNYVNRFLDPDEIAGLFLGEDDDLLPSEGFDDNKLPFFEIGDGLFLVISLDSDGGFPVCWPSGERISSNLFEFVSSLSGNPRFYHNC